MRRWGPLLLVLAALGALAVHLLLRGTGGSGGEEAGARRGEGEAATAPSLRGSGQPGHRAAALPSGRARVTGTVLHHGRPVAAEVTLRLLQRAVEGQKLLGSEHWRASQIPGAIPIALPEGVVRAGADGRFAFEGLAAGEYGIVASTLQGARGSGKARVLVEGVTRDVRLEVRGGDLSLRGRVVNADGSPWHGQVDVALGERPQVAAAWELVAHATDGEGRFEVGALEAGPAVVIAWIGGRMRHTSEVLLLPRSGEYVLRLPAFELRTCRVLDATDGHPLVGAAVIVGRGQRSLTDAEGLCHVGVSQNSEGLLAMAEGYAPSNHDVPAVGAVLEVRLVPRRGVVRGQVREQGSGAPVEGALVWCLEGEGFGPQRVGVSDVQGAFTLDGLTPGEATILVLGGGWVSPALEQVRDEGFNPYHVVVPSQGILNLDLEALRAARAQGRVLTADAAPVAGATVTPRPLPKDDRAFLGRRLCALLEGLAGTSGDDGRYELSTLVPDVSHVLRADAVGQAQGMEVALRTAAGATLVLDIHFPAPRWARIRVVEEGSGAAIPGARVGAGVSREGGRDLLSVHLTGDTDDAGAVRLGPFPPGPVMLDVTATGWTGHAVPPVEDRDTEDVDLTVTLQRSLAIAGRARYADGSPGQGLEVSARWGSDSPTSYTDAEGRFHIQGVPAGRWTLVVTNAVGMISTLWMEEVEAGRDDVELVIPGRVAREVRLRVLDQDGKPVPQAEAWVGTESAGGSNQVADGILTVDPMTDSFWIGISEARDAAGKSLGLAPALLGPLTSDGSEHEVRLVRGSRLSGQVVGPAGAGVRGIAVMARARDGPEGAPMGMGGGKAVSDVDGRFTLAGLSAGAQILYVTVPPIYAPVERIESIPGSEPLRIVLRPSATWTVQIVDASGAPVERAGVQVSRLAHAGGLGHGATDAEGRVRLEGLAPDGIYALEIRPPDDQPLVRRLAIERWRASHATIALPAARRVAGLVVDEAGRPVPGANVTVWDQHDGDQRVTSDAAGRFALGQLAPDAGSLIARFAGPPALISRSVPIPTDGSEVRMVLRAGRDLLVHLADAGTSWIGAGLRILDVSWPGHGDWVELDVRGAVRFEGLDPEARYAIFGTSARSESRLAYLADVRGDAGEVRFALQPALAISGRVRGLPPGQRASVTVRERAVDTRVRTTRDGAFTLTGLPAGTWTLTARATLSEGGRLTGEASAPAGGTVEIDLAPAR